MHLQSVGGQVLVSLVSAETRGLLELIAVHEGKRYRVYVRWEDGVVDDIENVDSIPPKEFMELHSLVIGQTLVYQEDIPRMFPMPDDQGAWSQYETPNEAITDLKKWLAILDKEASRLRTEIEGIENELAGP